MIPSIKSELPNSFCTQFEYMYNGSTPNVQKYFSHPRSPRLEEWHMIHIHIHATSCINTVHFVYVHGLRGRSILALLGGKKLSWYLRGFIEGCISVPTIIADIFLALPPMATYIVFYYDTWIIWCSTGLFRVPILAYDLSTWVGGTSD